VKGDNNNNKTASITVPVKFTLKCSTGRGYDCEVKIMAKLIQPTTGTAEFNYDPDQPELPLNGQPPADNTEATAAPVKGKRGRPGKKGAAADQKVPTGPDKHEFYFRVTDSGELNEGDLDNYFAASSRWKDYAGWLAAGNGDQARKIINDEKERAAFIDMVNATLNPASKPAA